MLRASLFDLAGLLNSWRVQRGSYLAPAASVRRVTAGDGVHYLVHLTFEHDRRRIEIWRSGEALAETLSSALNRLSQRLDSISMQRAA